jgi:acetyl esterase/lipase
MTAASRRALLLPLLALALPAAARAQAPAGPANGGRHEVRVVRDVAYHDGTDADPKKHRLDLYLPKGVDGFPVVLFIHGGGWSSGDRRLYGSFGTTFARNGVGAVVISYRLSPGVQHPAHVEDVARAFAWTRKNIARYGGRPDAVFVTGQSAGGHLAALLATNDRYLNAHGLSPRDMKGVMPMSGVYVFRPGRLERVLGKDADAADSASPLKHVTGKEPPFLIVYADRDFPGCALMSRNLQKALTSKKVEADLLEIKDRTHITIIVRLMFDESDPATRALLDFVARHAGPKPRPSEPAS